MGTKLKISLFPSVNSSIIVLCSELEVRNLWLIPKHGWNQSFLHFLKDSKLQCLSVTKQWESVINLDALWSSSHWLELPSSPHQTGFIFSWIHCCLILKTSFFLDWLTAKVKKIARKLEETKIWTQLNFLKQIWFKIVFLEIILKWINKL